MNRRARSVGLAGILAAAGVIGCAEEDCSELSQSACEQNSKCTPRIAIEVSGDTTRERFAGCDLSALGCNAAETCAQNTETKEIALFRDTCLGRGWAPVSNDKCKAIRELMSAPNPRDSGSEDDAGDSH
jgi:hypothetical protein